MGKSTNRIIALVLAIFMVVSILPGELFKTTVEAANGQDFDVAIKVIKADGTNETYYAKEFATFQGGVINDKTAPKIQGLSFVRAYVRDLGNKTNVTITEANYREIGKKNLKKRVFFKMANTQDDGVESSYTWVDTRKSDAPKSYTGVTEKIFFEYYETAEIYKVNYFGANENIFVDGPRYVQRNKSGDTKVTFSVSSSRSSKQTILNGNNNAAPEATNVKFLRDISTADRKVITYEATITGDSNFYAKIETPTLFTVGSKQIPSGINDWFGSQVWENGKNQNKINNTLMTLDYSHVDERKGNTLYEWQKNRVEPGGTVNFKVFQHRLAWAAPSTGKFTFTTWLASVGVNGYAFGVQQPLARFGPGKHGTGRYGDPESVPGVYPPYYYKNAGVRIANQVPGFFAKSEGWRVETPGYWTGIFEGNDRDYWAYYDGVINKKVIDESKTYEPKSGPLAGSKITITLVDAKPSAYQGALATWNWDAQGNITGRQRGADNYKSRNMSYNSDNWNAGRYNSLRLAYDIKIENVNTDMDIQTEWVSSTSKIGNYLNYGVENMKVAATKVADAERGAPQAISPLTAVQQGKLKFVNIPDGGTWIDGPALLGTKARKVTDGINIVESPDPIIWFKGDVKNGYVSPKYVDETLAKVHGGIDQRNLTQADDSDGFSVWQPTFAFGASEIDYGYAHSFASMNIVGVRAELLQIPVDYNLNGGTVTDQFKIFPTRAQSLRNPQFMYNVEGNPVIHVPDHVPTPANSNETFLYWDLAVAKDGYETRLNQKIFPGEDIDIRKLKKYDESGNATDVRLNTKTGNQLVDEIKLKAIYTSNSNRDASIYRVEHVLKSADGKTTYTVHNDDLANHSFPFVSVFGAYASLKDDRNNENSFFKRYAPMTIKVKLDDNTTKTFKRVEADDEELIASTSNNILGRGVTGINIEYREMGDVIPNENGTTPNPDPDNYISLKFESGTHGDFAEIQKDGQLVNQTVEYFVNKNANPLVKLGDVTADDAQIKRPTATIKSDRTDKFKAIDAYSYDNGTKVYNPKDTTHQAYTIGDGGTFKEAENTLTQLYLPVPEKPTFPSNIDIVSNIPAQTEETDKANTKILLIVDHGGEKFVKADGTLGNDASGTNLVGSYDNGKVKFDIAGSGNSKNAIINALKGKKVKVRIQKYDEADKIITGAYTESPLSDNYSPNVTITFTISGTQFLVDGQKKANHSVEISNGGSLTDNNLPNIVEEEGQNPENKYKKGKYKIQGDPTELTLEELKKKTFDTDTTIEYVPQVFHRVEFVIEDTSKLQFKATTEVGVQDVYYVLNGDTLANARTFGNPETPKNLTVKEVEGKSAAYTFDKWYYMNPQEVSGTTDDIKKIKITSAVKFKARANSLDIVPDAPESGKPAEYALVTFNAAPGNFPAKDGGTTQTKRFWVRIAANKKLSDLQGQVGTPTAPTDNAFIQFEKDGVAINWADTITTDVTYTAKYVETPEITTTTPDPAVIDRYYTITFVAGEHASLEQGAKDKVYVLRSAQKKYKDIKTYVPNVVADANYGFVAWFKDQETTKFVIDENNETLINADANIKGKSLPKINITTQRGFGLVTAGTKYADTDVEYELVIYDEIKKTYEPVTGSNVSIKPQIGAVSIPDDEIGNLHDKKLVIRTKLTSDKTLFVVGSEFKFDASIDVVFTSGETGIEFTNPDQGKATKTVKVIYGTNFVNGFPEINTADVGGVKRVIAKYVVKNLKDTAGDTEVVAGTDTTLEDEFKKIDLKPKSGKQLNVEVFYEKAYKVTFATRDGAKLVDNKDANLTDIPVYYVKEGSTLAATLKTGEDVPTAKVISPVYENIKWFDDTSEVGDVAKVKAEKISKVTTFTAKATKQKTHAPIGENEEAPAGYRKVIFTAGTNGQINPDASRFFAVKKTLAPGEAAVTVAMLLTEGDIKVTPKDSTFTFDATKDNWLDSELTTNKFAPSDNLTGDDTKLKDKLTLEPEYGRTEEIITEDGDGADKPGYYKLLFRSGEFGNFGAENKVEKSVYVRNDSKLKLKELVGKQVTKGNAKEDVIPTVTAKSDFKYITWTKDSKDIDLTNSDEEIKGNMTFVARYLSKIKTVTQDGWNIKATIDPAFAKANKDKVTFKLVDENDADVDNAITGTLNDDGTITFTVPTGTTEKVSTLDTKKIKVVISDKAQKPNTITSDASITYNGKVTVKFTTDNAKFTDGDQNPTPNAKQKTVKVVYGSPAQKQAPNVSDEDISGTKYKLNKYTKGEADFEIATEKITATSPTEEIEIKVVTDAYHKVTFSSADTTKLTVAPKAPVYILAGNTLDSAKTFEKPEKAEKIEPPAVTAANPAYKFKEWVANDKAQTKYDANAIKTARIDAPVEFKAHANTEPFSPYESDDKVPEGFAVVEFVPGAGGSFNQVNAPEKLVTKWVVDPKAGVTIKQLLAAGKIVYTVNDSTYTTEGKWIKVGEKPEQEYETSKVIDDAFVGTEKKATLTPKYDRTAPYIEGDGDLEDKPGYIEILFNAGDHGNFGDNSKKVKTLQVRNDLNPTFKSITEAGKVPGATADTDYEFKAWHDGKAYVDATSEVAIKDKTTFTAKYLPKVKDVAQNGWNVTAKIDKGFVNKKSSVNITLVDDTDPNQEAKVEIPEKNITVDNDGNITITIPENKIPDLNNKNVNVKISYKDNDKLVEKGTAVQYRAGGNVKFVSKTVDFTNPTDKQKAKEKVVKVQYNTTLIQDNLPTISNDDKDGTKTFIKEYKIGSDTLTEEELLKRKITETSLEIEVLFKKYHKVTFVAETDKVTLDSNTKKEMYILEGGTLNAGQEEADSQPTTKQVPTPSVTSKVYELDGWKDNQSPAQEYKDENGKTAVDKIKEVPINKPITFTAVAKALPYVEIGEKENVPDGFRKIIFESGENGAFNPTAKKAFAVAIDDNLNPAVTLETLLTASKIQVTPNATYLFDNSTGNWIDKAVNENVYPRTTELNKTTIQLAEQKTETKKEITLQPQYTRTDSSKESDGEEDEDGYTSVIFKSGSHGKLKSVDTTTQPQKYVDSRTLKLLSDLTPKWQIKDLSTNKKLPEVKANDGWINTGWKKTLPKPEVNHVDFDTDVTEIDTKHIFEAKYLPELKTPTQDGWNILVDLPDDFTTTDENNITITLVDEDGNPINGPNGQPITGTVVTDDDGNKKIKVNVPTDNIPSLDGKKVGIKISENDPGNNNPPSVTTDPIKYDGKVTVKFKTTISTFTDGTNIQKTEKEVKVLYGSKLGNNLPNITEDSVDGNTKYKIRDYDFEKTKPLTPDELVDEVIVSNSKTLVIPVNVNEYVKVFFSSKEPTKLTVAPNQPVYVLKGSTVGKATTFDGQALQVPNVTSLNPAYPHTGWEVGTTQYPVDISNVEINSPTEFKAVTTEKDYAPIPDGENAPAGYKTLIITPGDNGTFETVTASKELFTRWAIKPNAQVTLETLITEGNIKVVPNNTYSYHGKWLEKLNNQIIETPEYDGKTVATTLFTNNKEEVTLVAKYTEMDDIIPTGPNERTLPGYIKVSVNAGKHGSIEANNTEVKVYDNKVYYLIKDKQTDKVSYQEVIDRFEKDTKLTVENGYEKTIYRVGGVALLDNALNNPVQDNDEIIQNYLPIPKDLEVTNEGNITAKVPNTFTEKEEQGIIIYLTDENGKIITGKGNPGVTGTIEKGKILIEIPEPLKGELSGKELKIKITRTPEEVTSDESVTLDDEFGKLTVTFVSEKEIVGGKEENGKWKKVVKVDYNQQIKDSDLPELASTEDVKVRIINFLNEDNTPFNPREFIKENKIVNLEYKEYVKVTFEVDASIKDRVELNKETTYYVTKGSTLDNAEEINLSDKMQKVPLEVPSVKLKGTEKLEFSHWSIKGDETTKLQTEEIYEYEIQKPTTFIWNAETNLAEFRIVVKYVDEDGNKIKEDEVIEANLGGKYDATPYRHEEIDGRRFIRWDKTSALEKGTADGENKTIIYIYENAGTTAPYWPENTIENDPRPWDNEQKVIKEEETSEKQLKRWAKYMQGNELGEFMPEKHLTRAEAAQILYNMLKEDDTLPPYATNKYIDLDNTKWYYEAVIYTSEKGLFVGNEKGEFMPDKVLTRAEWITVLARLRKLNVIEVGGQEWYTPYILSARIAEWLDDYNETTDYLAYIPRKEVSHLTNRALGRNTDPNYVKENINSLKTFSDIQETDKYYLDIINSANTYYFESDEKEWIDHETSEKVRKYFTNAIYENCKFEITLEDLMKN